jgi:hypothetical protein
MDQVNEIEFKVDEQYENEKGVFTVVSLHKEEMVIRWESGEEIRTAIELQRRIQERRQWEKLYKEEKARAKSGKRASTKGAEFHGYQATDFKKSASGTKWRGRGQLGGSVTQRITSNMFNFNSWANGHKPELHWFDIDHRGREDSEYQAKFFTRVDQESLFYGFYIIRPEQSDLTTQDWNAFYEWLKHQDNDQLMQKMAAEHQLIIQDRNRPEFGQLLPKDGTWQIEGKNSTTDMLISHIDAVPEAEGITLEIIRKLDKSDAIERKDKIADDIAELFMVLMPLYQAAFKI